jgi:ENTS family enterobactin (siderophore) exporter
MRIGQIVIDVTPLRESRDFRWLYGGRFVASAGNVVAMTAANWQVYTLTRSPLAVGLLSLTASIGMLVSLLAGGVLADRYDRRKLLLATGLPQALLAGALLANSLLRHPAVWAIYVITLAIGLLAGIGAPASTAAAPALVGPARLAAAAALNGMGNQLGNLAGPALAGLLIAGPGLAACYGVDAACFAAFGVMLLFVRPLPPTVRVQRPGFRSLAEGFRYVRHSRVLGSMLLIDTSAMIFGMPAGLFPALAAKHFHGGSATFGLLTAAPGLGAMVGAASSGWTGRVRRPGMVVIGAGIVWGGAILGFGLTSSLPVALAFLAVAGAGDMISEILRNALLQIYAPDELRGRLSSLYLAQVNTAPALGNTEAGIVAQLFSLTASVVSGGLACVAGALLLGALFPALRHATLAGPAAGEPTGSPAPQAADLPTRRPGSAAGWSRIRESGQATGTLHPPLRPGQLAESEPGVQAAPRLRGQDLADSAHVGMADGRVDQERAETASPVSGIDEHVTQPGEGGEVSDEPREADLRPVRRVDADDHRVLDGLGHRRFRAAFRPVALAADPVVNPRDVDQLTLVAGPVAIWSWPFHDRLHRPAGGMTGSPGGGPSQMRRSTAAVSRCSATRSPSTSSRACRAAAKSVSWATEKSRPVSAATSVRNARRNASFSSVPCQLVPQTAPLRQPSRNGSASPSRAAIPWWIS